jgi:hypothetical protein
MSLKNIATALCLLIAACGDGQDDGAAETQPTAYAQMNHEQRAAFMSAVVLPQMSPIFTAFDAKFQNMSCTTCHGSGATDGTFAMPSPQIPPLPASEEAFYEYMKDPEHARWSQFMIGQVWPKMAALLQVDMFDPATHPDGFSCHNCHTLTGP